MTLLLFLAQTIRIAVPYLFAAAGGALAERAGIVSLSLEGYMLGGAFGAVIGSHYASSAWIGAVTGVGAGLMLAGIHAACTLRFRADQIVTGVAINHMGRTEYVLSVSEVRFRQLDDEEIRHYVMSGEPMDKAGAYGIDRKSTRLNSSHIPLSRMPSSA